MLHRSAATALVLSVFAGAASAVHWEPVGADGVTSAENVVQHTVAMAWTHEKAGGGALSAGNHDDASLTHIVEQSPGSPSFASTSVRFDTDDSAGFQPADLLVSLPIGDPHRGARAIAQTTSEIFQVAIAGELHSASAAPGAEPEQTPWRYRLEPTGGEINGEPIQIRAFASIDGQVGASASPTTNARILSSFTVNGQSILSNETTADENANIADVDESAFVVLAGNLGDVIEIGFSIRTDANVLGPGPRLASADVTSLRYDIEIRLVREIADLNTDGVIDTADLGLLIANFGLQGTNFDLNADGIIDTADLGLLISVFGMPSI